MRYRNILSNTAALCLLIFVSLLTVGCATQSDPSTSVEAQQSDAAQREAQKAAQSKISAPLLKRKLALGRITNETKYGQSLLRTEQGDPLGKQVTDLLSKALTESQAVLVFERPDISALQSESELTGNALALVGVDTLLIGSLTEFGRKTVGKTGFVSSTKKQVAFAKVDLRLVDSKSGLVYSSISGAGEASTEAGSVFGFGSRAGYDGTLNDGAIRIAISEAVNQLVSTLEDRAWTTDILSIEGSTIYISGGTAQGITPGMIFSINTQGEQIKSKQTGATIQLPGKQIAQIRIDSTFGDTELNQGSVGVLTAGSIANQPTDKLEVVFMEAAQ